MLATCQRHGPKRKFRRLPHSHQVGPTRPSALIHNRDDNVAVAVVDIKAGDEVATVFLEDMRPGPVVRALNDIPLGHKIALRDIPKGSQVIKYGRPIGVATADIRAGEHVHVHNLKSLRWGW